MANPIQQQSLQRKLIYIGLILGAGLLWYFVKGRNHIGTLESHAAASTAGARDHLEQA